MSKVITNEDGTEETVFTQAELDAQLLEKDNHLKTKLDEFTKGKTAQELSKEENKAAIEAMKKEVDETKASFVKSQETQRTKVVNFLVKQVVGEDVELTKKLAAEMAIVEAGYKASGKDVNDESIIQEMISKSVSMAGINAVAPSFPMNGGFAPNFNNPKEAVSDAEHEKFLKETGYKA
jgi:exopolysaccharide biosynthesis protein